MSAPRRKRNPDSVLLNFVDGAGGTDRLRIVKERVNIVEPPRHDLIATVSTSNQSREDGPDRDPGSYGDDGDFEIESTGAELTSRTYENRQKKLNEAWERVRGKLTQCTVKSASLPPRVSCTLCNTSMATVYCRQCGGYLCSSCTDLLHNSINLFHKPLIWKVYIE